MCEIFFGVGVKERITVTKHLVGTVIEGNLLLSICGLKIIGDFKRCRHRVHEVFMFLWTYNSINKNLFPTLLLTRKYIYDLNLQNISISIC